MKNSKILYADLNQQEKKDLLTDLYINKKQSFADIAEEYSTYANKIRRDAKKLNIPIRTKSEAQKNALNTGKHKHPTKGTERSNEVKNKIGSSVMESWENMSKSELKRRSELAKANWEKLPEEEKQNMLKIANEAVRVASKTGSKLEKYLLNKLIQDGHSVDFHKEQTLVNTKLQIDLFLPKINIAIEVDGPSHFAPVWGEESLKKSISYDQKKQGLIIGKGWTLIRIQQKKDFSNARAQKIYTDLKELITKIQTTQNKTQSYTIKD